MEFLHGLQHLYCQRLDCSLTVAGQEESFVVSKASVARKAQACVR